MSMIFLRSLLYTLVTCFLSMKWNHNIALFLSLQRLPRWFSEVMCKSWFTLLLLQSDSDHLGSNDGKGQCTTMWPGVQYFLHGIRHLTVFIGLIKSHSIVCVGNCQMQMGTCSSMLYWIVWDRNYMIFVPCRMVFKTGCHSMDVSEMYFPSLSISVYHKWTHPLIQNNAVS
jgi:hypothetical protein